MYLIPIVTFDSYSDSLLEAVSSLFRNESLLLIHHTRQRKPHVYLVGTPTNLKTAISVLKWSNFGWFGGTPILGSLPIDCFYVCVCGKPWIKGYQQGAIPLIISGWPTKRPMMRAVYKRTCEFPTSDMARWLSHKPPLPTWSGNITWHYFMSSHFILSLRGVSKCVFHAPGSLIKCRGSLVVRPPGIPDYFQISQNIMLPEADSAQASRRCSSEFSTRSRVFQKSPDYMFRICQFTIFSSQISTCHLLLSAFFTGNCTDAMKLPLVLCWSKHTTPHWWHPPCTQTFEHRVPYHNPALSETALCRYQPCLSVVGCLLSSRKLWCSGLLLPAFCTELALNAVKLPLVLCWSKQHNVTDIWAPCSMSQHNTVGNSTHIEDHFSGSQNRAPAAWCAWKAPNQRVARWLSHKPPLPTWHGT